MMLEGTITEIIIESKLETYNLQYVIFMKDSILE